MDFETKVRSNWNEIKGQLRQKWGKLTDQDLETWKGNYEELSGKVERAYGLTKDRFEAEFRGIVDRFGDSAQRKVDGAKDSVDQYTHQLETDPTIHKDRAAS